MTRDHTTTGQPTKFSVEVHARRFAKFLVVGVLNTAFGYAVYAAVWLATQSHVAAVVVANVAGGTFNYFTIGRLVFANRGLRNFAPFLFGYLLILGLNLGLVEWLTRMSVGALTAQLIALPAMVLFSFAYNSLLTFRRTNGG